MGASAAVLKREIEAKLADRAPAALSPMVQPVPRLHATSNHALDALLDGGFPLGSLCEITGPECSGRSAAAFSLLATATHEGACAYIDLSDSLSPHSAAAAGVLLRNLLWVRFALSSSDFQPVGSATPVMQVVGAGREQRQLNQQNCGGPHPRGETKGLAPALEQMLFYKEKRRRRKMEGTPGYPNQPLSLGEVSPDHIEWEQFNSRKIDDRDPLRQLDKASAEAARQRAAAATSDVNGRKQQQKPWSQLDRALRATDQVLQAGGFRVIVLDLASLAPEQTQRIQPASWWRFQKAAKQSDAIFLVLSQAPCARSSATCVLECTPGNPPKIRGVLSSTQHIAQISRQRTGPAFGKKAPGRVTSWSAAPAWMRAVGRLSMSFAAVHIPEFPIAAWVSRAPQLMTRPLVLLRGTPPQEAVASLNTVAKASGISHGMSKVQSEAACAAYFRSRNMEEERTAFAKVLEVVDHFSPRVQAIATPANDYANRDQLSVSLLIDRSGTGSLFGNAQTYAKRLHGELASDGFVSSIATAPNADAALILARSTRSIICVDERDLQQKLSSLPTSLLECDPKTQALLRRWGVRTLGQLAALPETGLISRLGQQGSRLQQLARGEAPFLLAPEEPNFELCEALELESPLEDLERLLFALSRLLGEIVRKATDHAYAIRSLRATLALDRAQTHVVRVTPATPTQDRDALLKLLQLELQAHPPQSEVVAVRLDADPAQPQIAQRGLFQAQFPGPDKLDLLLARLRSITGEQSVGSAELANSHREDAFTIAPFRPELQDSSAEGTHRQRPALRMLRPPQVVPVWLTNERPHVFFWRGTRFTVSDAAGPWHATGSWWDRSRFDCDYWDVITEQPAYMLRLQQEHTSHVWNVLGLYD